MTSGSAAERECTVFCRYLSGHHPTAYILEKYHMGQSALPSTVSPDMLERALLAFAVIGPRATRLADSYAALFRRDARLRLKLILLVAILENSPGTHEWYDSTAPGGRFANTAGVVWTGITWMLHLPFAVAAFGPVHLISRARLGRPRV